MRKFVHPQRPKRLLKSAVRTLTLASGLIILNLIPFLKAEPPFWGTIFLDPDIITESDPTAWQDLEYAGRGDRWMYDRRADSFLKLHAFLFNVCYTDGLTIEIQVNPEFEDVATAQVQAEKYAPIIGRLPTGLRRDVKTSWIHLGTNPFGGGNNNLLIHTGQAALYDADGILEETLVHEASHTSLDADHAAAAAWIAAQEADPDFISTYARDNPTREDIAESYLLYLALRHRSDRISSELADSIVQTMPNRIAYFDAHPLDLFPLVPPALIEVIDLTYEFPQDRWLLSWASAPGLTYAVDASTDLRRWERLLHAVTSQGLSTSVTLSPSVDAIFYRVRRPAYP